MFHREGENWKAFCVWIFLPRISSKSSVCSLNMFYFSILMYEVAFFFERERERNVMTFLCTQVYRLTSSFEWHVESHCSVPGCGLHIFLATCHECIPAVLWVSWTEVAYTSYRCKTFWGILSQGKMKAKLGSTHFQRPPSHSSPTRVYQPYLAFHRGSLPGLAWPWLFVP